MPQGQGAPLDGDGSGRQPRRRQVLSGIRFRPPKVTVPPQLDWLLRAALGPPEQPSLAAGGRLAPDDPVLRHLSGDLWGRLSQRVPAAALEQTLGADALGAQRANRWRIAAQMLQHEQAGRQLGALAERLGCRMVFLKGLALHLGGYSAAGTRAALDIDLLVEQSAAQRLSAQLVAAGSRLFDLRPGHHSLPPIQLPSGTEVDIHVVLPGLSLDGSGGRVTAEQLGSAGLTRPIAGFSPACGLPERDLLAAHLLVHAIGQHGAAPEAYPVLRLLTDLQDLGFGAQLPFPARLLDWIAPSVSRAEAGAVQELLSRLEAGASPSQIIAEGPAGAALLLRHLLAGLLDDDYRQSLKLRRFWQDSAGRRAGATEIGRRLANALLPTRGQLEVIYGQPSSAVGYWLLRLARPWDLALRTARSAWAGRRVRRRPR